MSWFDAAGFGNLAKNALKEVQKTIDKALISEEEDESKFENEKQSQQTSTSGTTIWESIANTIFERDVVSPGKGYTTDVSDHSDSSLTADDSQTVIIVQPKPAVNKEELQSESDLSVINISSASNEIFTAKEESVVSKGSTEVVSVSDSNVQELRDSATVSKPELEISPSQAKNDSIGSSVEVLYSSSIEALETKENNSKEEMKNTGLENIEAAPIVSLKSNAVDSDDIGIGIGREEINPVLLPEISHPVAELCTEDEPELSETTFVKSFSLPDDCSASDSASECNAGERTFETAERLQTDLLTVGESGSAGGWDGGGSSCEENTIIGSSPDDTLDIGALSSASLKTMLAEAMVDRLSENSFDNSGREDSPFCADKIENKVYSSGHTSADELETATSSDIEVVSSTNGDSSSHTNSRRSPAKLIYKSSTGKMSVIAIADTLVPEICGKYVSFKVAGHDRAASDTSSGCSDDGVEIDHLLKKIAELSETLEARESKLIDLSMKNAELSENNSNLKSQLECQTNEELSQRLTALEKKFQQAIREKDTLRKQLDAYKQNSEFDEDKDQVIKELREEGEKLSKHQLLANNLIKKLRASEAENQKIIASLREQQAATAKECDRITSILQNRERVEKCHVETIQQLTKANQITEKQARALQSQIDNLSSTLISVQKSVEEKEETICRLKEKMDQSIKEARKETETKMNMELESEKKKQQQLFATINEKSEALKQTEQRYSQSESLLKQETSRLRQTLERLRWENENLKEEMANATVPIVKQLNEELSKNSKLKEEFSRKERTLLEQFSEMEKKLKSTEDQTRCLSARYQDKCSEVDALQTELLNLKELVKELRDKCTNLERENSGLKTDIQRMSEANSAIACNDESRDSSTQTDGSAFNDLLGLQPSHLQYRDIGSAAECVYPPSPPFRTRRPSFCDSVGSVDWPMFQFADDEPLGSASSQIGSVYDGCSKPIATATSLLENLQSLLKQKEGEVHQLQWQLRRRDHEREMLTNQISQLSIKVDELEPQLKDYNLLRRQYDELLQMYGEKEEAFKELQLDIQDIKEIHKIQITQLLDRQGSPSS